MNLEQKYNHLYHLSLPVRKLNTDRCCAKHVFIFTKPRHRTHLYTFLYTLHTDDTLHVYSATLTDDIVQACIYSEQYNEKEKKNVKTVLKSNRTIVETKTKSTPQTHTYIYYSPSLLGTYKLHTLDLFVCYCVDF